MARSSCPQHDYGLPGAIRPWLWGPPEGWWRGAAERAAADQDGAHAPPLHRATRGPPPLQKQGRTLSAQFPELGLEAVGVAPLQIAGLLDQAVAGDAALEGAEALV